MALRAAKKIATSEFLNTVENRSTAAKIPMHIQWRENNKKKSERDAFQVRIYYSLLLTTFVKTIHKWERQTSSCPKPTQMLH